MKDENNNQADLLQHLVNEVQANSAEEVTSQKPFSGEEHLRKVDVLNLPPRKEIHKRKGWVKLKFSRPLVRFLLVCIAFVLIFAGIYYYWGTDIFDIFNQL